MASARMLTAAVLLAALALPAAAGAALRPAQRQRPVDRAAISPPKMPALLAAAAGIGVSYWGAAPCRGQVAVLARRALPDGVDGSTDAWVTFDSALGANDLAAPASSYSSCIIAFARSRWPTAASIQDDWDVFCMTMTHEIGHLLGHAHDDAPGSVMAPLLTDLSAEPPGCRSNRPSHWTH